MGNDKMTNNTRFLIWLTLGIGFCSPKPKHLLSLYGDLSVLYNGKEQELRLCGILTQGEINRLMKTPVTAADEIISRANELGQQIVDITEDAYPASLRCIDDAPAVLYVQGTLPDFDNLESISIIGTRKATVYGVRTAFELGANLSREGFVVVSGGALGIDCAAHRGVLASDGITVCVLGCGIDYDYLRENKAMRNAITVKGALISEYPPGSSPAARNFPQRNRIISALSKGLVVVEAPKASGSMITVSLALTHGKDIFAVMGNVDSVYSEGSNALIKDGAIPVTSYKDVAEYYLGLSDDDTTALKFGDDVISSVPTKLKSNFSNSNDNKPVPVHNKSVSLTQEQSTVYYIIGASPIHVDEIAHRAGMPVYKVLSILSTLEMNDLIVSSQGRNYTLK